MTGMPFIEQLKKVGFAPSAVMQLLKQFEGDTVAVLQHLYQ